MNSAVQTIYVNLDSLGIDNEVAEQINLFGDEVAKLIEHMFKHLGINMTVEAEHPMNFNAEESKAADEALGDRYGQVMKLTLSLPPDGV